MTTVCVFLNALSCIIISSFQRRVVLSFVACFVAPYFSTLSNRWHDFRRNFIDHKSNALIFPTSFSGTFLIIRTTQRGLIDFYMFSYKVRYF